MLVSVEKWLGSLEWPRPFITGGSLLYWPLGDENLFHIDLVTWEMQCHIQHRWKVVESCNMNATTFSCSTRLSSSAVQSYLSPATAIFQEFVILYSWDVKVINNAQSKILSPRPTTYHFMKMDGLPDMWLSLGSMDHVCQLQPVIVFLAVMANS